MSAFESKAKSNGSADNERIAFLEQKIHRKDEVLAELMEEHVAPKKSWGGLKGAWMPHDTRDGTMDFVNQWPEKTGIAVGRFIDWMGISKSKFYDWVWSCELGTTGRSCGISG